MNTNKIEKLESECARLHTLWHSAEVRVRELKQDRDIIHQDCERWRALAKHYAEKCKEID